MKKITLEDIPKFNKTISQAFHDGTKLKKIFKSPDPSKWPEEWRKVYFKSYPRLPIVNLPKPKLKLSVSLKRTLFNRHSVRNFSQKSLSLEELSTLLYFSAGIKGSSYVVGGERFYPSAGARYPLEVYPMVLNVRGLKNGIYHYYVKSNSLEVLDVSSGIEKEIRKNIDLDWAKEAAVILIITAVFYRTQMKYYERGYRHILSELGGLNQNIYLLSTALQIGCCSMGGYFDDGINKLLDLEDPLESVVGVTAVGKV